MSPGVFPLHSVTIVRHVPAVAPGVVSHSVPLVHLLTGVHLLPLQITLFVENRAA